MPPQADRDKRTPFKVWARPDGGYLIRGGPVALASRVRKVGGKWNPELRGLTVTQVQWEELLLLWMGDKPDVRPWDEFVLTDWTKPSLEDLSAAGKSPGSSTLNVRTRAEVRWLRAK